MRILPLLAFAFLTLGGHAVADLILVTVESYDGYSSADHVYAISTSGTVQAGNWPLSFPSDEYGYGTTADDSGNGYIGTYEYTGSASDTGILRKVSADGVILATAQDDLPDIFALGHRDGAIFASSYPGGSKSWLAKYDTDLTLLWKVDTGHEIYRFVIDSSGDVLAIPLSTDAGNAYVRKYSGADGSEVTTGGWPYTSFPTSLYGIAIDASDRIAVTGYGGGTTVVQLLGTDGTQVWSVDPAETSSTSEVVFDASGDVVVSDSVTLAKLSAADGSTAWSVDHLDRGSGVSLLYNGIADGEGSTYWTAQISSTSFEVAKVSSAGAVSWETTFIPSSSGSNAIYQLALTGVVAAPSDPIVGQPDDRYRSSIAADAGSLLASQQAVPFDTSSSITFGWGSNLDQTTLYALKEVTRDQEGSATDVLFYPRARQGQGERNYDGLTLLTLMERNYPPAIFDTTDALGLGGVATAQEIIEYVLGTWDTRYAWFSYKTVPDLRTRVDGLPAPSEYGARDGVVQDTAIAIRQDDSTKQSMRQILDGLLSPFPGTIYYQDSEGDLVVRPAYGPDADETPVTTFEESDVVTISVGEPDAFNIVNRATVTAGQYERTTSVEVMQPAWFQTASNHLMGNVNLFTPPGDRLNLSGETTSDESTRQAESPHGSFASENRLLAWPIQTDRLLGGTGITPTVTAAYFGDGLFGSHSGTVSPADITVTPVPLTGDTVDVIRVASTDFDVTIRGRWDADAQTVRLSLGSPMRLESGGVSWVVEFTLNDSSTAFAEGGHLTATFGNTAEGDALPAVGGGNAITDSQAVYGVLEATVDARVYGNLTQDELYAIAKGIVQQNISPRATRDLVLGWKGSTKALFDRRGRLVALPNGGEGHLTGVRYSDDFASRTGGKVVRVEETVTGAAGVVDTGTAYLMNDDATYWQNEDGLPSEEA